MEPEAGDRVRAGAVPPRDRAPARSTPTAATTVEALMYGLRRGLSCLDDPANRDRLRCCDDPTLKEIVTRLRSWKSRNVNWLRPWADEDITKLVKVRSKLRESKRDG
jgi:hypothetical protein